MPLTCPGSLATAKFASLIGPSHVESSHPATPESKSAKPDWVKVKTPIERERESQRMEQLRR